VDTLTPDEFARSIGAPLADDDATAVLVDIGSSCSRTDELTRLVEPLAQVVIGVGPVDAPADAPPYCDLVVTEARLPAVLANVEACPLAATALALLLRGANPRSVAEGLIAESATFSMLQAGPEFAAWRASRAVVRRAEEGPPVLVERVGDELRVTLNRPHVRNAFNAAMRDDLVQALDVALADPEVRVTLAGAGEAFCAGGDLDEFGSRPDPASAHVIRLRRNPAMVLHRLADRVEARLHGACVGSGIELPAFAGRVVARPDCRVSLPEVALGLIPGAGGTVSLPRRIGRHRTAWLALSGESIDAQTALAWGLADEIAR
jgi:hypothetical protein